MYYYHVSYNPKIEELTPMIPSIACESFEDVTIPRACLSESIDGCLSAIDTVPGKYYVYRTKNDKQELYKPTVDQVRDAKYTKEVWSLKPIPVDLLGVIQISDYDSKRCYYSGRGKVYIRHYPYEWIEKYPIIGDIK